MMFAFLFKFLVGNRKLCEAPYNKTVDWAKWYIFWADERVVGKTHADSNYKLAKDGLLSKVCAVVSFLYIHI
jgi:6-phosphogluconolactonase